MCLTLRARLGARPASGRAVLAAWLRAGMSPPPSRAPWDPPSPERGRTRGLGLRPPSPPCPPPLGGSHPQPAGHQLRARSPPRPPPRSPGPPVTSRFACPQPHIRAERASLLLSPRLLFSWLLKICERTVRSVSRKLRVPGTRGRALWEWGGPPQEGRRGGRRGCPVLPAARRRARAALHGRGGGCPCPGAERARGARGDVEGPERCCPRPVPQGSSWELALQFSAVAAPSLLRDLDSASHLPNVLIPFQSSGKKIKLS